MNFISYLVGFCAGILYVGWFLARPPHVAPWWVLILVGGCGMFLLLLARWVYYFGKRAGVKSTLVDDRQEKGKS